MVPLQALQYNEENPHVQDSVKMTIQDWNVVNRRYVTLSLFIDLSVHTFSLFINLSVHTFSLFINLSVRHIQSAGWCNGNILASHAADWGSIPGCGRSASHQTVSGTASAGDAHSLVRRTNPPYS